MHDDKIGSECAAARRARSVSSYSRCTVRCGMLWQRIQCTIFARMQLLCIKSQSTKYLPAVMKMEWSCYVTSRVADMEREKRDERWSFRRIWRQSHHQHAFRGVMHRWQQFVFICIYQHGIWQCWVANRFCIGCDDVDDVGGRDANLRSSNVRR